GGIRAKSKRGAIGEQWWSRRFISVLESYGMSGRLARGRNYARAGQVLDFELSQGKVTARVQGSRVRPYQVRIGVLPLTTAQGRVQADAPGPGRDAQGRKVSAAGAARPGLAVPAPPLEDCLDGFWSPGLSPARLRALASAPDAAAPDLLLRMFPPPPIQVRG